LHLCMHAHKHTYTCMLIDTTLPIEHSLPIPDHTHIYPAHLCTPYSTSSWSNGIYK